MGMTDQHHYADLFLLPFGGVLPKDEAIGSYQSRPSIEAYGQKGEEVVKMNYDAVDNTLANLHEVKIPSHITSRIQDQSPVPLAAPEFVRKVTSVMMKGKGDCCLSARCRVMVRTLQGRPSGRNAEHRFGNSCLGQGYCYPVRQMCHGLPARGHSYQSV